MKITHMFIKNNLMEFNFQLILNQEIIIFPCKTVNTGTKIIVQIKHYMHFLTLGKEQHSAMRKVTRKLFPYTSSVYLRNCNS